MSPSPPPSQSNVAGASDAAAPQQGSGHFRASTQTQQLQRPGQPPAGNVPTAAVDAGSAPGAPPPLRHRSNVSSDIPVARSTATNPPFEPPLAHRSATLRSEYVAPEAPAPEDAWLERAARADQSRAWGDESLEEEDDEDDGLVEGWEHRVTEDGQRLVRFNCAGIPSEWMPATPRAEAARAQLGLQTQLATVQLALQAEAAVARSGRHGRAPRGLE